MVRDKLSYTRIARVAGDNNSAQLAGDSHNMRRMLYLGSVKALLHSTKYAACMLPNCIYVGNVIHVLERWCQVLLQQIIICYAPVVSSL